MKNRTIICLHGYGKRRGVQFKYLVDNLNTYDFVCPNYYTLDPNDSDYLVWLNRVETCLEEHKDDELIIIGFSLGAVFASYFANKYDVKKLIFLGASFEYDYFLKVKRANPESAIPLVYLDTFVDVIDNCASSIKDVKCPVTFIHAKGDEIIPCELSIKYHGLCQNKESKLILLEGGQHMLFDNEQLKDKTVDIIREELVL